MHKKYLTCFTLLFLPALLFCQTNRIDGLKAQLIKSADDKSKLNTLLALCKEQNSLNPDTLRNYAVAAKALATAQQDKIKTVLAEFYIATQFSIRGAADSCLQIINTQLQNLHYTAVEKEAYINFCMLKARTLNNINKAKEGLDFLYPLLQAAEQQNDTLTQIRTMNAMAGAYVSIADDKEAQRWCFKALQLFPGPLPSSYADPYEVTTANISVTNLHLYETSGDKSLLEAASTYADKAIKVSRDNEFLSGLAYSLGLEGTILGYTQKKEEGEVKLEESLKIYTEIGNSFYIANAMAVLGNFYGVTNQPEKGIAICREGIALTKGAQVNTFLYSNLAGNYKLAGDYKAYGETMEELSNIKDSIHKKNAADAVAELQTKYETQKKENTIIQQNYALTKKNYLAYGSFALLILGGIFSFILFKENKKKQGFKLQMLQKEEKRRSEIAVSTAEEKERNRIAAELHDNLGGQLSYISSNMDFILDAPAGLTEAEKHKHLSKVNETAKSTIADLRESIWALKKQQVEIDELADKLKLYAQNHLLHKPATHLEVKENISQSTAISSADGLHIFRIFQEAINNASKYSGASTITLSVTADEQFLYKIALLDNGKGFDTTAVFPDHYGLENMQQRAKAIGAVLTIESSIQTGTLISLEKIFTNTKELLANR